MGRYDVYGVGRYDSNGTVRYDVYGSGSNPRSSSRSSSGSSSSSRSRSSSGIVGVGEVNRLLEEVGRAPAKVLTIATRKGANVALRYAKAHVPVAAELSNRSFMAGNNAPGNLKRSLRIKKEKRKTGKSVYTVGANRSGWYAHFLDYGHWATGGKRINRGKSIIGKMIRNAQTTGMTWVPGNRFLRDSVDKNRGIINDTILSEMAKELDKLR